MPDGAILQRNADWPRARRSTVLRAWAGRTVACIASGPSVNAAQVARVHAAGLPAIAVNDAYLLAPWAALCYFADLAWWRWHDQGIARPALGLDAAAVRARFAAFAGQKCSIEHPGQEALPAEVHLLGNAGVEGLSELPDRIMNGRSSGYQALNIAVLAGAARIVLLGYDGRLDGGRAHFFGDHPVQTSASTVELYSRNYRTLENPLKARGIEVLNASPGSAIPHFPRVTLEAALQTR